MAAARPLPAAAATVDVDGAVGRHETVDGARVVEVEPRLGQRAQPLQLGGRDPARGGRGGGRLEPQPQLVDLAHVAQGERGDDVAAARLGQHQPLDPQARQRAPDRGLGEAEAGHELGLGHRRAGRQLEPHDGVAQPLVGGGARSGDGGVHGAPVY